MSGKLVSGKAKTVTDGPFAEKDIVGGYTLVEARDLGHAVELAIGRATHVPASQRDIKVP